MLLRLTLPQLCITKATTELYIPKTYPPLTSHICMPTLDIRPTLPRPLEHRSPTSQKEPFTLDLSTPPLTHHNREPTTRTPISSRSKCILCLIHNPCTTTPALSFLHHPHMYPLAPHQCLTVYPAISSSTPPSSTSHNHLYPLLLLRALQRLPRKVMGWCSIRLFRQFQLGTRTSTTILRQLPQYPMAR